MGDLPTSRPARDRASSYLYVVSSPGGVDGGQGTKRPARRLGDRRAERYEEEEVDEVDEEGEAGWGGVASGRSGSTARPTTAASAHGQGDAADRVVDVARDRRGGMGTGMGVSAQLAEQHRHPPCWEEDVVGFDSHRRRGESRAIKQLSSVGREPTNLPADRPALHGRNPCSRSSQAKAKITAATQANGFQALQAGTLAGPEAAGAAPYCLCRTRADSAVLGFDGAIPGIDGAVLGIDGAVPSIDGAVPSIDGAVPGIMDGAVFGIMDSAVPSIDRAVPGIMDGAALGMDSAVLGIYSAVLSIDSAVLGIYSAVLGMDGAVLIPAHNRTEYSFDLHPIRRTVRVPAAGAQQPRLSRLSLQALPWTLQ
ncbi:hypothetical protein RJ55_05517 [Drechmeria coniospora]|nr:hypothetical protein RJ55_05517 [Drechmeria coniospora]